MKLERTDPRVSTVQSPQSNGKAERTVQIIRSKIKAMFISRAEEWDELLPIVVNAIGGKRGRDGCSAYEICLLLLQNVDYFYP